MDLISREAVIDGIEELKKSPWANDNRNGYEYLIPEALGTVKDLCVKDCPSAFEGMTNGEVMKAVFESDNVQFDETGSWIHIIINGMDYSFCPVEFWNAPYKAESEDKAE